MELSFGVIMSIISGQLIGLIKSLLEFIWSLFVVELEFGLNLSF